MQAGPRPLIEPNVLGTIRDALKGLRSVHFRYGPSGRLKHVDPWGLLFGRLPYLVGPAVGHEKAVLWRLDRMRHLALSEPAPGRPAGFSLAAYAARSFGTYQEPEQDVLLRFSPGAAEDAARFIFHPDQRVERDPEGSLVVGFRAGGMLELVHHLFTWGEAVEILSPNALRDLMRERLRSAMSRHG